MDQPATSKPNPSTELNISGMTCASCVRHVEKALLGVPGVSKASVNLATERARVEKASTVSSDQLIHAVEAAGYHASVVKTQSPFGIEKDLESNGEKKKL